VTWRGHGTWEGGVKAIGHGLDEEGSKRASVRGEKAKLIEVSGEKRKGKLAARNNVKSERLDNCRRIKTLNRLRKEIVSIPTKKGIKKGKTKKIKGTQENLYKKIRINGVQGVKVIESALTS